MMPKKSRVTGNGGKSLILLISGWIFKIQSDCDSLEDQEKTTFTCPFGTFPYRPFGLCNALGMFQRCRVGILNDTVEKIVDVFMDNFFSF